MLSVWSIDSLRQFLSTRRALSLTRTIHRRSTTWAMPITCWVSTTTRSTHTRWLLSASLTLRSATSTWQLPTTTRATRSKPHITSALRSASMTRTRKHTSSSACYSRTVRYMKSVRALVRHSSSASSSTLITKRLKPPWHLSRLTECPPLDNY